MSEYDELFYPHFDGGDPYYEERTLSERNYNDAYCRVCEECDIGIFIHGSTLRILEEQLMNLNTCQEACERCNKDWAVSKAEVAKQKIVDRGIVDILDNERRMPRSIILGQDITSEEHDYALSRFRRRKEEQGPTHMKEVDKNVEEYSFNVKRPPLKGE